MHFKLKVYQSMSSKQIYIKLLKSIIHIKKSILSLKISYRVED